MLDVAIIGGGLSGLSLATHLMDQNINFSLFDARERYGGRILSVPLDTSLNSAMDLGPSWIWPEDQPLIKQFIKKYQLEIVPQWTEGYSLFMSDREQKPQRFLDPTSYAGAYRIQGGSGQLIESLIQVLPPSNLFTCYKLSKLIDNHEHVDLHFTQTDTNKTHVIQARQVALMLPPRLCAQSIEFTPHLPGRFMQLMQNTPTWMACNAKVSLVYEEPFWRTEKLSGSAFANYPGAILGEIFDSSSEKGEFASLTAFFALPFEFRQKYRSDLETLLLDQLVHLFGNHATKPLSLQIQDWSNEEFTASISDQQPLTAHPSYGDRFYRMDHWNDKLYFGGSETAKEFGGYLEGALQSAQYIAQQISISQRSKIC